MLTSKVHKEGQTGFGMGPLAILRPASYHSLFLPPPRNPHFLPPHLTDLGENLGSPFFSQPSRAPGLALTFPGLGECHNWASQPSTKGLPLGTETSEASGSTVGVSPLLLALLAHHVCLDGLWHSVVHLHTSISSPYSCRISSILKVRKLRPTAKA